MLLPSLGVRSRSCALALGLVFAPAAVTAQCATNWLPGDGWSGANSYVYASTMWDPDGAAGPAGPVLVVAGIFTAVGDCFAQSIAAYDPVTTTWSALGQGLGGGDRIVSALTVLPNGDLVAAGRFTTAGGVPAANVARWNGTTWSPLGGGITRSFSTPWVNAMTVAGNGDLVVGGRFDLAGGATAHNVARWDGTSWSPMGMQFASADVLSLVTLPNGRVVAGSTGTAGLGSVTVWDGATWSSVGPQSGGNVPGLAVMPNGDLVACGHFAALGGVTCHASRWNGVAWVPFATQASWESLCLHPLANGDVILGGALATVHGVQARGVARWDGTTWHGFGAGLGLQTGGTGTFTAVRCLTTLPDGSLVAGGTFTNAGSVPTAYLARWNGSAWLPLTGQRSPQWIQALAADADGGFYAATYGLLGGTVLTPGVSRWDGQAWQSMPGITAVDWAEGRCLSVDPIHGLLAAGRLMVGSQRGVARWTGTAWALFGSSHPGDVNAIASLPGGDVVIGDNRAGPGFSPGYLWHSNGGAWTVLGGGTTGEVRSLRRLSNGDLIVGGSFAQVGAVPAQGIARWSGTAWSPLGTGVHGSASARVLAIVELPDGSLVVGGAFPQAGGLPAGNVARWDGASWSSLGTGMDGLVNALHVLPDGDLLAGGLFSVAGGVPAAGIARWRGGAWQPVGAGVAGSVYAFATGRDGDVAVGGGFATADGQLSVNFARLESGCPASAVPTPTSCVGPAGPIVTAATTLPWLGSTLWLRTTGLTPTGLVVGAMGFGAANVPLATLHPGGLPGCALENTHEAWWFAMPNGTSYDHAVAVPDALALIGVRLRYQVLLGDPSGGVPLQSVSSSNSLLLQVGDF
jgi:hypothetical protein